MPSITALLYGGPADGGELKLTEFTHYIRLPIQSHETWSWTENEMISNQTPDFGMAIYRCQRSINPFVYRYKYEQTVWTAFGEMNKSA